MENMVSENKNIAGGSATGGGINFQAAVSAIATVHMIKGQPLQWLNGIVEDIPVAIDAETGGAGDDIRFLLKSNEVVEIQVKKGLKRGDKLWDSLIALAKEIHEKVIDYGVLIVSSSSSNTITESLSKDIIRLGDGRSDSLSDISSDFVDRLKAKNLPVALSCKNIRIQIIHAMTADEADVRTTHSILHSLCNDHSQVTAAWNSLYKDAAALIELRGRRDTSSISRLLSAEGIQLLEEKQKAPVVLLNKLCQWVFDTHAYFSIFGVKKKLRVDHAWIPLRVVVQETAETFENLSDALTKYQSWDSRPISRDAVIVDPETLGRFIRRGVLVGGPGMGKTTLLKRIARRYSEDRIPVLHMKLKAVAARMRDGQSFEEAAFTLSLDGSGIRPAEAKEAIFSNWLLLCDGLDECGALQEEVAAGVERFSIGYPDCRVLVTTRPIGYDASHFSSWRHYNLSSLNADYIETYLTTLVSECGVLVNLHESVQVLSKRELKKAEIKKIITRSPLLLGLAASVIANGGQLLSTKEQLYEQLFRLIDDSPNSRTPEPPAPVVLLQRYLDILGWNLTCDPLLKVTQLLQSSAEDLRNDLGCSLLKARADAENYLNYWEAVGVVEKIGLNGILTFVHKSFGEFAAARHIVQMPLDEQNTTLVKIIDDLKYEEVIKFSAQLGLADSICRLLICEGGSKTTAQRTVKVGQALTIMGKVPCALAKDLHEQIIDAAFDIVLSENYSRAFLVSKPLVAVARRYPKGIGFLVSKLLDHKQPWTHLIAWWLVIETRSDSYTVSDLELVLPTCISNIKMLPKPSLEANSVYAGGDGKEILQAFMVKGIEIILDNPSNDQSGKEAIQTVLKADDFLTVGFMDDLQSLLVDKGENDLIRMVDEKCALGIANFFNNDGQKRAWTAFFEMLFDALEVPKGKVDNSNCTSSLLNFSAFLGASKLLEMPLSDLRAWVYPFDKVVVKEVLSTFVKLSAIDVEALRIEAYQAKSYLFVSGVFQADRLFKITTDVDLPDIDWGQTSILEPDVRHIIKALFHSSQWIVEMATNMIENMLSLSELALLIERLISNGGGYTIWVASRLLQRLDKNQAVSIILKSLGHSFDGREYLIRALKKYELEWSAELSGIFQQGLYQNVRTAVEVAELSENIAKPRQVVLESLVCRAFEYWVENEKPYPVGGGIVPESPREKLLEALIKIRPLHYTEIKRFIVDQRPDVKKIAEAELIKDLKLSNLNRSKVLDEINNEALPLHLLPRVIDAIAPFDPDVFEQWKLLIIHENPRIRFAAMKLLDCSYLEGNKISKYAQILLDDEEQEIREKASEVMRAIKLGTIG